MDLIPHIFHEQQEGNLCAQHCLNSLLQGPYFTAIDLAELAQQLDIQEQQALDNVGPNAKAVTSQNMDDSGFFSVQVLSHALSIWNIQIIPWRSKEVSDAKSNPEREAAFICNLDQHWYTLRRFGPSTQRWYDLNSLHPHPRYMSATYLGMTLSQLEAEGYSIFVVRPIGEVQASPQHTAPSATRTPATAPAAEVKSPTSSGLTERQEMERLRRQRQEERERALRNPSGTDESVSSSTQARVDQTSEVTGAEEKSDLVTTPSFLPQCEVDILAASMPLIDSSLSAPKKEQSFEGAGYRLGGSLPLEKSPNVHLQGTGYGGFEDGGEEETEWEMMQQAIAMSLASQPK
ncbi:Ataxin-3 [Linnemannia zychae]|nr:Ataxin-3 [Linnemannia zychae]